jgi:DNA-binding response OmpR family regulator
VVDDEIRIARFIELELKYEGYEVEVRYNGREGLAAMKEIAFDLIILDVMMPDLSGIEVLRRIRQISDVPVIMLTAKGETMDKVMGLDFGADDYLTKPFEIEELLARIRSALRRYQRQSSASDVSEIAVGLLVMDFDRHEVHYSSEKVELTKKEFDLLEILIRNKGVVLSREKILNEVWGYDFMGDTNVVDVYIRYIRSKVDDRFNVKLIHTVRGVGYVLKDEENETVLSR